jgi:hypothetical protein
MATTFGRNFAQFTKFFFDKKAVEKAAGKAKVVALSRFGAVVRRVAQTSMRYRKGASAPGTPPSAHKSKRLAALKKMKRVKHNGALLREFLFFAYDPRSQSVVVGPVGFKSKGKPIPALHEFGGERQAGKYESMEVKNPAGRDPKTGRFFTRGTHTVKLAGKSIRYPKRPFMGPALDKAQATFAQKFKGTITR